MKPIMTHPFEHLAPGPYRFVGLLESDEVSLALNKNGLDGIEEGGCIGSCDHCYSAITIGVMFKGSDGKKFKVGETCAKKAFEPGVPVLSEMKKACNARRLNLKKEKEATKFNACIQWLNDRTDLNDLPHPKGFNGLSLGDYFQWYREQAGKAKFVEICKEQGFK